METGQLFRYQTQLFCILDENDAVKVSHFFAVITVFVFGLVLYLLCCKINSKIKSVSEPNTSAPWNETYCVFFVYNLRILKMHLFLLCCHLLSFLAQVSIGPNWYKVFFVEIQQRNLDSYSSSHTIFNVIETLSVLALQILENLNILVHLMEWHSMLFIILTQKNRPV